MMLYDYPDFRECETCEHSVGDYEACNGCGVVHCTDCKEGETKNGKYLCMECE